MSVKRFDASTLGGVQRTPQGGLRIPSRPTRAGVLLYRNGDGTERREFRPPSEVFHPDSLASLQAAPVTDFHPAGAVTPENWRQLTVGHVGEDVKQDGSHVSAPLNIQDAEAIRNINAGDRKELSCGYTCDLDETPGIWEGQHYDAIQRNIRYNHVALLPTGAGRGGASVALRLDSTDAVAVESDKSVSSEGRTMIKVRVDGIEYEAGSEGHLQAVAKMQTAAEAKHAELAAALGKAQGEIGALTARADTAEKSAKEAKEALAKGTDPKVITAAVKARADMLDTARRVAKITGARWDDAEEDAPEAQTADGMLLQILKMIEPDFDAKGKDPQFLMGYSMARISALLKSEGSEEEEDAAEDQAPAGNNAQAVSGGVAPPAAPGRSDSREGIHNARGRASREDGTGESVIRGDSKNREDSVEAAEARMHKDHSDGWQQKMAFSK